MKFLAKIFMGFFLVLASCNQDEDESVITLNPTAEQNGFALVYTSTTCGICGGEANPRMAEFATQASKGAIVSVHVNAPLDAMSNQNLVDQFSAIRELGGSIPKIWVGDSSFHHSNQGAMNDLLGQGNSSAGVDFTYSVSGGKYLINCAIKFFKEESGDYYISFLLLEDGIDGSSSAPTGYAQSGTISAYPNDDYKHKFVLRKALNDNVLGEKLGNDFAVGQTITKSFSISYGGSSTYVYPVAIIWRFDPASPEKIFYINSVRK